MANFVCCFNLLLVVLALCASQGNATYGRYKSHYKSYYKRATVSFKHHSYAVKESAGRVAITIQAAKSSYYLRNSFYVRIRASVNTYLRPYASSDDFEQSLQTVTFSPSQSTKTVYIKINDDDRVENTEAFQVEILISYSLYLQGGVRFGSPSKVKVYIKDDDKVTPPPPCILVQFSQSQYMANESDGYATVTITLNANYNRRSVISVYLRIFLSSRFQPRAASSYDVWPGTYAIVFNPGVNSRTVRIKIRNDNLAEGTEAFGLQLIVPYHHKSKGLKLGNNSIATVFINDDDTAPATSPPTKPPTKPPTTKPTTKPMSVKVQFEFLRYTVNESCTLLPVTLVVKGEVLRPFTVSVRSMGFHIPSAEAGNDFNNDPIQVTFQPGESQHNICVVIIDDDIREGNEKFRLLLSIPYSVRALGVWTGYPYYADVLITDDPDDGMGLPVQLPPTDDERATMCVCKPRPTLPPPTPTPTSSPILIATPTPSLIATPSPTLIATPSPSLIATPSPSLIATPSPSVIATPTPSLIATPSSTLMPSPSPTLTPSPTPSPSPSLNITVIFNASSYSGDEADGVIAVTVVATGESPVPYNVTITPSELANVSARELFDYFNETIVVTFNPGETEKTVLLVVNPDCTREGSEFFDLNLSLDSAAVDLGITLGDPSVVVAEIEDTDIIHVNFSQPVYSAEEVDGRMMITLQSDGFSIWPYSVEINPMEILPVGAPGNAEGNGTDFDSNTLIAVFNPGDSRVDVSMPVIADQIFEPTEALRFNQSIPDEFSNINGRLLVIPVPDNTAEGEIIDSNVLVNFSADSYRADVNDTNVIVRVMAFGSFASPFLVEVIPIPVDVPEGDQLFFDANPREVLFPLRVETALVPIQLFPEEVEDMDLQFNVTLVVPSGARSQGVVLGEPSMATVTVPATRP